MKESYQTSVLWEDVQFKNGDYQTIHSSEPEATKVIQNYNNIK